MLIALPLVFAIIVGLVAALTRAFSGPQLRVETIERRKGAAQLSVRTTDGKNHGLEAKHTRVRVTKDSGGEGGPTYTAWLDGPELYATLVRSGDRDVIQRFVRRLEFVIGLDSIPPR